LKNIILKAENISKQYRLGLVGTGTLQHDLNRWWHEIRGKENPYLKIGDTNDRSTKGTSDYVWALQDINFEVERGEVLGIIGKNGAGKSTLLKILSKVAAPTTGSIKSRGRIASLLEVGTGFNGEMTGRENIYLNGAILGMTRKEITSKLDEIIDFSGCQRYIDTPVKRYSSGMYVRLAFAVAAFLEPEILIVDEVLAVGDAEFQKKAIGKMQDISRTGGRTVLFVSHNMAAVKSLCTTGIVLDKGKIIKYDNIEETVSYYLSSSTIETDFTVNLKEHTNRISGMRSIINRIELLNSNKEFTSNFTQDQDIFIKISYDGTEEENIAGLGFIIYNSEEIRIGGGNTYMYFQPPHVLPKAGNVIFQLKSNQLNIGRYMLTISIGSHQSVLIDKVEHCISFNIEPADVYKTGYFLTKGDGVMVLNFEAYVR
jgi:lipopolysaccharide transport system ATP-binding protein